MERRRVSSGVQLIDQSLGGGIPEGSVVCVIADPMSMAEVLLYQFASSAPTYYFVTTRGAEYVKRDMMSMRFDPKNVEFVDVYTHLRGGGKSPDARRNLYVLSKHNASKSTKIFMSEAEMPKDMFWKFEFWPRDRALTVVGETLGKIFSEMMRTQGSSLHVVDIDPKGMHFLLRVEECEECANMRGEGEGVCQFYAGSLSGILSALLGKDLDAYETECRAVGGGSCTFSVGLSDEVKDRLNGYLSPPMPTAEEAIRYMRDSLGGVKEGSNIVVDTFSFFIEVGKSVERIREVLNVMYEGTNRVRGVTMLYVLKDAHPTEFEKMVIGTCDGVFHIETRAVGSEVETSIAIPKMRGTIAPSKRVRLVIGERVSVDTSRAIA